MAESAIPGDAPVSLNEARSWLRMGATIDDAVVAGLIRAATGICEVFVGQWLIVRAGEEILSWRAGAVQPTVRPIVAIDGVALLLRGGGELALDTAGYSALIGRDGTATIRIFDPGEAERVRLSYRAGLAEDANGIPEAIRQGILRMMQHLHDARDGSGTAPPAAIAALWQPWRRLTLGGER